MANHHAIYVGQSGGGKNVACFYDLEQFYVGKTLIVLNDPRGDNTAQFLSQINYDKVIIDDVTQNRIVLPIRSMRKGKTLEEKEYEIDRAISHLSGLIDGRLIDSPMKLAYLLYALEAWQVVPEWLPAYTMKYLFQPRHTMFKWWIDRLTGELFEVFWRIKSLHESTRIQTVGSAERLISIGYDSLALRSRDMRASLPWRQLCDEKYIVITKGGKGCPRNGIRSVMRARNMEVIQFCEHS